jgi:hypothetical protein
MLRRNSSRPPAPDIEAERAAEDDFLFREDDMSPRALMVRLTLQAERRIDEAFGKKAHKSTK